MDTPAAFRAAVERFDLDAAVACMGESIVFHSPVTFHPLVGRDAVRGLFTILFRTFEDFRYVGSFDGGADGHVLRFRTRVGDRDVEGIDLLHLGDDGLIDDFTVMVRPLSAATALRDAIGAQLAG